MFCLICSFHYIIEYFLKNGVRSKITATRAKRTETLTGLKFEIVSKDIQLEETQIPNSDIIGARKNGSLSTAVTKVKARRWVCLFY
jgi:hypothetical protein